MYRDLRKLDGDALSRAIRGIADCPPGTRVAVRVRPFQLIPGSDVEWVRRYGRHLDGVEVDCSDPDTGRAWREAFFAGVNSWIA